MIRNLFFSCALVLLYAGTINAQAVDLKVVQSDLVRCDTSGTTTLDITLVNNGGVPIIGGAPVLATYQINGGPLHTESIDFITNCNPGDTAVLSFVTPYLFDQHTTYNCMYAIDYLADDTVTNDTVYYTRTFWVMPGYGNHSNDTSVCLGDEAYLMMELTGNGPWLLDIVMGPDTLPGLPVMDPVLATYLAPDSTMQFTLLSVTDVNGCTSPIGIGITITVNDYPEVNLGTDTSGCAGDSIILDAGNPGATYTWWAGTGGQTWEADTADWGGALGEQTAWVDVNMNGCVTRDSVDIEWILCPDGLNEISESTINVFPNPGDGLFIIDLDQPMSDGQISVFNFQGELLFEKNLEVSSMSSIEIDLRGFSNGSYLVLFRNDHQTMTTKLLKQ